MEIHQVELDDVPDEDVPPDAEGVVAGVGVAGAGEAGAPVGVADSFFSPPVELADSPAGGFILSE